MSNKSGVTEQIISLPKGGGAQKGLGEKFQPDLHTGTGNFSVPIAVLPGRNGFQPQLTLSYSTGQGNGPYGLGWSLSVPNVSHQTAKGIPRYQDNDTFVLSGAEDLVLMQEETADSITRRTYRPRTEGLFARIVHVTSDTSNHWEVTSKDGLTSIYGATVESRVYDRHADHPSHIFQWLLTETQDPFGNRIVYTYKKPEDQADLAQQWYEENRVYNQIYLSKIEYANYTPAGSNQEKFLLAVEFDYGEYPDDETELAANPIPVKPWSYRPDPFSTYRAGFEIRTVRRCRRILLKVHDEASSAIGQLAKGYRLRYQDELSPTERQGEALPLNGISLLATVTLTGYQGGTTPESLPPLAFHYTRFITENKRYETFHAKGNALPDRALNTPDYELIDLHGYGLPDVIHTAPTGFRYWRNLGNCQFDFPQAMRQAPAGVTLAEPGVQFADMEGNGAADLLVTDGPRFGYFPTKFDAQWSQASFQKYQEAPSFNLKDPDVKLVDMDGDGIIDVLQTGQRYFLIYYNRGRQGWDSQIQSVPRKGLAEFPDVHFSTPDQRVRLAAMSGDGLQDIVYIHNRLMQYWPNLGYGRWGRPISMRNAPQLPYNYDPKRLLLADIDGDGYADLIYVALDQVHYWLNQSGNAWSAEHIIAGTPAISDVDAVRAVDMKGTGTAGILWSYDYSTRQRTNYKYLDLTGGVKPYLLDGMDNNIGATTHVDYAPSTQFAIADREQGAPWLTHLPFPVQVVERVEVIDHFSKSKLMTRYAYHHGYWDGVEREFRGFGRVEQYDTEAFADYLDPALHGNVETFAKHFSPPTLTKRWFHQGAISALTGGWAEADYRSEFWSGDPQQFSRPQLLTDFLHSLPLAAQRDALRALRGTTLRTELYALDNTTRQDRPYTVTEQLYGLHEVEPPNAATAQRQRIFFPYLSSQRTTQWERGADPLTHFAFTDYRDDDQHFDAFGRPHQQTTVAMPRRAAKRHPIAGASGVVAEPDEIHILATHSWTAYAEPEPGSYLQECVAQVKSYELNLPPTLDEEDTHTPNSQQALVALLNRQTALAQAVQQQFLEKQGVKLIGHVLNHYDGNAFDGLAIGQLGHYGALTRSQALVFTPDLLDEAYAGDLGKPSRRPRYLGGRQDLPPGAPAALGANIGYTWHDADNLYTAGYYADTKRVQFDFQDTTLPAPGRRGLVVAIQDALGHTTTITPDQYWLLPVKVSDPVGLETSATYNYRVIQPEQISDANGHTTHFCYSPLGLLQKQFLVSRDRQGGSAAQPELAFTYDFHNYEQTRHTAQPQPIYVHGCQRIWHATDNVTDDLIESREYSDGFGRLIQKRAQAETLIFGDRGDEVGLPAQVDSDPGPALGQPRPNGVVVSGWQIYDNKGRVVEKYEPFFDDGWQFQPEQEAKQGVHGELFYDPRGQVIRTLNPDGSEQRVLFGVPGQIGAPDLQKLDDYEPTPWESYTYDGNDLAAVTFDPVAKLPDGSPKPLRDRAPAAHYNTPQNTLLNAQGKVLCQVARNGQVAQEHYITRSTYDVRGNLLNVWDALGRKAFQHAYDLLNRPLRVDSIDAGLRTSVLDVLGNLLETRDSKGSVMLHEYDALNRPTRLWARNQAAAALTLREWIDYGDHGQQPATAAEAAERLAMRERNALGKPIEHWDEAGVVRFARYDFKGNLLAKSRQVVSDLVLGQLPIGQEWVADWAKPDAANDLDATFYQTDTRFDALNRPIELVYPKDVNGQRAVLQPTYNRAGTLAAVKLNGDTYVDSIAYNAKGQRVLIAYGNNIMTRYAYDPHTFRLVRLRTEKHKPRQATDLQWVADRQGEPKGWLFQDFGYEYDLAGNITTIHDRTPGSGIPNTLLGSDALDRRFTYDPLYCLTTATGREYAVIPAQPWDDAFKNPTKMHQDPTLTTPYTQSYIYDPAGNLAELRHLAATPATSGSKRFALAANHNGVSSNRLATVTVGQDPASQIVYPYRYDENGNLVQEGESRHFTWDYADHLVGFRTQATPVSPPSVAAHYLYDAGGMRVKKWVLTNDTGSGESTTYIDGFFEHQHWQKNGVVGETNHLHVMDNQSRVALVRVGMKHPDDGGEAVQYYLGDHLGSSNIVVGGSNEKASIFINSEEYFLYGESSFGSFGKKGYRFTGKERDEESGLSYHVARYFASWLSRWISCDSAGMVDGTNLYRYARNNPTRLTDPIGTQAVDGVVQDKVNGTDLPAKESSAQGSSDSSAPGIKDNETNPPFISPEAREFLKKHEHLLQQEGQNLWYQVLPKTNSLDIITSETSLRKPITDTKPLFHAAGYTAMVSLGVLAIAELGIGAAGTAGAKTLTEVYLKIGIRLELAAPSLFAVLRAIAEGLSGSSVSGPSGSVSRQTLQMALSKPGPTVSVITSLSQAPQAGRALSVAAGEGAEALAKEAGLLHRGSQIFTAEIPKALIVQLERIGLVEVSTTIMKNSNSVATEYRFLPAAAEFIAHLFKKQ